MRKNSITNEISISEEMLINRNPLAEKEFKDIKKIYELFLLYYILKTNTDENHALSATQITELLNKFVSESPLGNVENDNTTFSSRTIDRKLISLVNISQKKELTDSIASDVISSLILGGTVKTKKAAGIEKKKYVHRNDTVKRQNRYYFEPSLSSGDMNMIIGSILSNRYLSSFEKDYLIKRLHILHAGNDYSSSMEIPSSQIQTVSSLPVLPDRQVINKKGADIPLPVDANTLLEHIQVLNDAINSRAQIEIEYGTYDCSNTKSKKITFIKRSSSILNPYALMWNKGGYYLIASNIKYNNPTHYRVDRIISIKMHSEINNKGELFYPKWKEIPEVLKDFITIKGKNTYIFDAVSYANRYPSMRISKELNLIDFSIECTSWSLQILVDYFGSNLKIEPSPIAHKSDEVDYNGKLQQFYSVEVRNVQYDNARDFCLSHPQYLTVLAPKELVSDVKDILTASIKRLS